MKFCAVDLETTGLNPGEHVILAIGAVVFDEDGNVIDLFSRLITPTKEQWEKASPKALEVNGLTLERLTEEGVHPHAAFSHYVDFLLKNGAIPPYDWALKFVGQNPAFDIRFLEKFAGRHLDFYGIPYTNAIDVRSLYDKAVSLRLAPFLQYKGGANISKALGVPPEPDVHDALEGALVVMRNFLALRKLGVS